MNIKINYKLISSIFPREHRTGFTLLELLLASSLTLLVVSMTGWGMFVMLRENVAVSGSSDVQNNLNRAVDFMADEVKSASSIYRDMAPAITAASAATSPSTAFSATGKTIVLALDLGLTYPVIYYFQTPSSSDPWFGPRVLYRWGPGFLASGAYTTTWGNEALVDMIASAADSGAGCPSSSYSLPTATGSTVASNTSPVFACVDATGKSVEINAFASLEDQLAARGLARNSDSRFTNKAKYSAQTLVYARSTANVTVGTSSTFSVPAGNPTEATLSASGCTLPISITYRSATASATASMNQTSNFSLLLYNASPSMSITSPSGMNYVTPTAATNSVQFTNGTCTVTARLTTP